MTSVERYNKISKKRFVIKKLKTFVVTFKELRKKKIYHAETKEKLYEKLAKQKKLLYRLVIHDRLQDKYPNLKTPHDKIFNKSWKMNRWDHIDLADKIERVKLAFEGNYVWKDWDLKEI